MLSPSEFPYAGEPVYSTRFELVADAGYGSQDILDEARDVLRRLLSAGLPDTPDAGAFSAGALLAEAAGARLETSLRAAQLGRPVWTVSLAVADRARRWRTWSLECSLSVLPDDVVEVRMGTSVFDDPAFSPSAAAPPFPRAPMAAVELVRLWTARAMSGDGVLRESALHLTGDGCRMLSDSILSPTRMLPIVVVSPGMPSPWGADALASAVCGNAVVCTCAEPDLPVLAGYGVPGAGFRLFLPGCDEALVADPSYGMVFSGGRAAPAVAYLARALSRLQRDSQPACAKLRVEVRDDGRAPRDPPAAYRAARAEPHDGWDPESESALQRELDDRTRCRPDAP